VGTNSQDQEPLNETERSQLKKYKETLSGCPNQLLDDQLARFSDEERGKLQGITSTDDPNACDLCGRDLSSSQYYLDARHREDLMWSNMCGQCFFDVGEGIGWGKGQLYSRQASGEWLLVAGFPPDGEE